MQDHAWCDSSVETDSLTSLYVVIAAGRGVPDLQTVAGARRFIVADPVIAACVHRLDDGRESVAEPAKSFLLERVQVTDHAACPQNVAVVAVVHAHASAAVALHRVRVVIAEVV